MFTQILLSTEGFIQLHQGWKRQRRPVGFGEEDLPEWGGLSDRCKSRLLWWWWMSWKWGWRNGSLADVLLCWRHWPNQDQSAKMRRYWAPLWTSVRSSFRAPYRTTFWMPWPSNRRQETVGCARLRWLDQLGLYSRLPQHSQGETKGPTKSARLELHLHLICIDIFRFLGVLGSSQRNQRLLLLFLILQSYNWTP